MYLPKLQNVFAQLTKCICKNFKMYLLQGEGNDHPKGCFALVCHLYVSLDCTLQVCTKLENELQLLCQVGFEEKRTSTDKD